MLTPLPSSHLLPLPWRGVDAPSEADEEMQARRGLTAWWLFTGIGALALAGLFAVLLVLARTPQIQKHIPFGGNQDVFHTALVVHVDLSVLVWFLAIACMLWQIAGTRLPLMICRTAWACFTGGMLLLALSPFFGAAEPLINNYIPVLQHPLFFLGLSLILAGTLLMALATVFLPSFRWEDDTRAPRWGVYCAALITLLSIAAFFLTYRLMPEGLSGQEFYETLFWPGGHLLQFTHTQLLQVIWLWLAAAVGLPILLCRNIMSIVYALTLLVVIEGFYAFFAWPVGSAEFTRFYTMHMAMFGGTLAIPTGLALAWGLWRCRKKHSYLQENCGPLTQEPPAPTPEAAYLNYFAPRPIYHALFASLVLFAAGGIISLFIEGSDVTIPAHYHGSIVGISLAFMGLAFHLLPHLGYSPVTGRWAIVQPWLYGGGQLLHISGLMISGGYNVARKTTASYEGVTGAQIGMGLMGMGGLLAILGGLLFAILTLRSILKNRS